MDKKFLFETFEVIFMLLHIDSNQPKFCKNAMYFYITDEKIYQGNACIFRLRSKLYRKPLDFWTLLNLCAALNYLINLFFINLRLI